MSTDRLWAPWRFDYIKAGDARDGPQQPPRDKPAAWFDGAEQDCFLCRAAAEYDSQGDAHRRLLVVQRRLRTVVVLNRYPYNNGHALVAPRRHVAELGSLTTDEQVECIEQLNWLIDVYRRRMNPDGFNIGLNLGRVAGAGVPGHLHWHLVPRWSGDSNFMPVLADTRVIPQSLDALWEMLARAETSEEGP